MNDFATSPLSGEPLGNQTAVALFGGWLTAKQTRGDRLELLAIQRFGDSPLVQKGLKTRGVSRPIAVGSEIAENLLGRGKLRQVDVPAAVREFGKKIRQIVLFGESRQLPAGVQTDIHQPAHPVPAQELEERLRPLLGESDRIE